MSNEEHVKRLESKIERLVAELKVSGTALQRALEERDSARKLAGDFERMLTGEGGVDSAAVRLLTKALRDRNLLRDALRAVLADHEKHCAHGAFESSDEARDALAAVEEHLR